MADDYSLSDFVTPGQVEAQRRMAEVLLKQSMITPVGREHEAVSPFAIGTQMTQALMGRMGIDQAGERERASYLGRLAARPHAPGLIETSGRSAEDTTDPSGKALSSLESGGNYNALGPIIKKGSMAGDRAYGKYGVMGSNIPRWTQEFLGHQMTPGEFLRNPEAQETVRKGKFAQYEQQFGPEGAARAWLGGPGGVNHPERADQLGTTIGKYGQNYMKLASNDPGLPAASPGGGSASAYAAEPAVAALESPDAPAAISKALAGGETKVAGGPSRARASGPAGAPAGAVQARPHMSWEQYMRASAGASEAEQERLDEIYMSQHAPIPTVGEFGQPGYTTESGKQHFYPGPPQFIRMKKKVGDTETEVEVPIWTLPPAKPGDPPTIIRGDEKDVEPTAPAAVPKPATPPVEPPLDLSAPKKGSEVEGKTRYAALNTGDTMTDAGPAGATAGPASPNLTGPLAVAPPIAPATGSVDKPIIPAEAPPVPGKEARMGDITPEDIEAGLSYSAEKERRTKAAEQSEKQLAEYGDASNRLMQSTNRLNQQIHDSSAYVDSGLPIFGPASELKQLWHRFLATGGNKTSLGRVSATEAFGKNVASEVLSEMKTQLEKMGQVRIAEIDLLQRAMASTDNTPQSNRAILFVLQKITDQVRMISKITQRYQKGDRWTPDGKPIVDASGNTIKSKTPPTASELRGIIGNYVDAHPLYGDEETAQKIEMIDPGGVTRAALAKEREAEAAKEEKGKKPAEPKTEEPKKRFIKGTTVPEGFQ